MAAGAVLLAVLSAGAVVYAWNAQQRVKGLEQQLVRRQADSSEQAAGAQLLAKQAQDEARESAAKLALLEVRVAEVSLQRTQLEELIQSLSRSRDENQLADIEAAIRVALQQAAITGSAEPLLLALRQADERLARQSQPRLEGVRRALTQDMERVRAAGVVDLSALLIRLDEVIRMVDELPLLATAERRTPAVRPMPAASAAGPAAEAAAAAASAPASAPAGSWAELRQFVATGWSAFAGRVWAEARSLIRVTPIDQPEAMLVAPEQAYFLRENLKLRLLNARLALLSRQFDTAQADLRDAQAALERWFDRGNRRVASALELVRQVSRQARQVSVPRPDATLAAIAAVSAGR
ncbi:MAG: uroporphyrinogen-III C-methyltransferase [Burkholderiales bacterium]|nr:uroporphyrinogen-III C-methyltransferase [Burkholderiales bacterium]